LVEHLKLERGELAEGPLPASAVVSAFDPGDDRQAQLLAGGPALSVENVLSQPREERLHGGVVTARTDSAHRSEQAVVLERADERVGPELPRSEWTTVSAGLRSPIALRSAATASAAFIRESME
jgi:hypothetical protein